MILTKNKIIQDLLRDNMNITSFPNFINNLYNWLFTHQTDNGAIWDPFVRSSLDFQYHYGWFILSSLVYFYKSKEKRYLSNAMKSYNYLVKLGYNRNKNSNSFIAIPLILSVLYYPERNYKDSVREYIGNLNLVPKYDSPKANNFHCMKILSLLLKNCILDIQLNAEEDLFIYNIINNKINDWQYDDGFFYDKPYKNDIYKGVPHLTYHITITMIIMLSSIILNDEFLFHKAEKGLEAFIMTISPSGEAFAYGRSNNSLFGYSNAIFTISLYNNIRKDYNHSMLLNLLLTQIMKNVEKDGHLTIVPNIFEKKRSGYDEYMFVIVYNSWALGILLLSHILQPIDKEL
jgi:hypothetical protein